MFTITVHLVKAKPPPHISNFRSMFILAPTPVFVLSSASSTQPRNIISKRHTVNSLACIRRHASTQYMS